MRDDEWDILLEKVYKFYYHHDLNIPDIDGVYIQKGRSKRKAPHVPLACEVSPRRL